MSVNELFLVKNEDRRIRTGHLWVYSNEVDTKKTPLKNFEPGQEVQIIGSNKEFLGNAYLNPQSLICARIFSRNSADHLNLEFFIQRISTALQGREKFFPEPFYRLVFGESDNLPGLIIDRFDSTVVVQIATAGMENCKDEIVAALKNCLPNLKCVVLRNDGNARLFENLPKYNEVVFGEPLENLTVRENNLTFTAPFLTGQKTGWFYDHSLNRARLISYVKNSRVLDVFSYLGAWGITAAVNGATEVTCVDSSTIAENYIKENAKLNNVADKVKVIIDDAFDALKTLHQQKQNFDVIILDPPAFIKKFKDKKEGFIAYQRINEAAIKLLNANGILISCSCSMHLSMDELVTAIRRASFRNEVEMQILEFGHQGPDHPIHFCIPETNYLKMVVARTLS